MKIIVATIGSRGDVQPYVNLSQGLQAAGHEVTLTTNPTLISLAESHGVRAQAVGPAVDMGAEGARLMAESFNNMWIGLIRVMRLGSQLVEAAYPDVLAASQGADLVVTSDTGSGIAEAEKLGIPWISVTLQPGRIPQENPQVTPLQRVLFGLFGKLMVMPVNNMRKRLGAPVVKDIASMQSRRLILLPVSPAVAPPDPRWPGHVRQTGYWFARPVAGWSPPPALLDFLQAGERPVVVSLGVMSMAGKPARQGAQIVLEAIRQAGVRAIIQGWDKTLQEMQPSPAIFHAGSLPHEWLFGQASAIVHHGGFGTTAAALRSGVPAVVIPHVIDQFYWGQRVVELGAGPQFISRGKLSAGQLAGALQQALHSESMRARAAEVCSHIRSETDGVHLAVSILESLFE